VEDIARERGFSVDRAGFEREMQKQRERSKRAVTVGQSSSHGVKVAAPTRFLGYEQHEVETVLIEHLEQSFIFEETPFYAEAGGQVADRGWIENLSRPGRAEVLDVQRDPQGVDLHRVKILEGSFEESDRCLLRIDIEKRRRTQRNHTATHILHAALRRVLGHKGGIQAGSLVAPATLRFDFTHFAPLKEDEIQRIEEIANHIILSDLPVEVSFETLEEAKSKGAMALFPEDYQGKERVRVVMIVEDGKPFSIELCGGTHVKHTGEIGLFKIVREEGVAAGVRRVYVATGENLLRHLEERECLLRATSQMLKASDTELISKLEALLHEREALERELRRFKSEWLTSKRDELLQRMERMDDYELVIAQVNLSIEELQELADLLEGSLEQGIVLLGSAQGGKVVLVCKVSDSVTDRLSAGEIVREVAQLVGGKGGGTPRFARGGGPQPERLTEALASIAQKIREELSA
jgi:alanyl-tRNA synthetase